MNTPPYLSRTPPPLNHSEDENEDEEFGTFVVSSDLGEEVFEVFDKASTTLKSEDNVSEDSGFCMNSCGPTQSPSDTSPLSSSYQNKSNEVVVVVHEEENDVVVAHNEGNNSVVVHEENDVVVSRKNDVIVFHAKPDVVVNEKENDVDGDDNPGTCSKNNTHQNISSCDVTPPSINANFLNATDENSISLTENNSPKPVMNDSFYDTAESASVYPDDAEEFFNFQQAEDSIKDNFISAEPSSSFPAFEADSTTLDSDVEIDRVGRNLVEETKFDDGNWGSDDDFSDFAEFQSSAPNVTKDTTVEDVLVKKDFEAHFPVDSHLAECPDVDVSSLETALGENFVWNHLQTIEESPACLYQWSKSCSNLKFLQAIQIDSRNIFHGRWSKMNKQSSHHDNPSDSQRSHRSGSDLKSAHNDISIPDAHFDWVSSGLVNPLQPTHNQHHTTEVRIQSNSFSVLESKKSKILATLPNLTFVKTTYIVFKRD